MKKRKRRAAEHFALRDRCTVVDRAGEVGIGTIVSRTFEEDARYDLRMELDGSIIKEMTADNLRRY
jgi:hypothetical protein